MKRLIYKILAFYIYHFKFPFKGEKYFSSFLKKVSLDAKTFKKKLHTGQLINLKAEDHIQRTLLWYGFYEKNSILQWEQFIENDAVVIDIGANIGYYTLIAANKAGRGRVHSFEPVTVSYEALQQNIQLNHLTNVTVNAVGISNNESLQTYYISSADNRGMSGMKRPENFSGLSEKKQTITLDSYAIKNNLSRIDIIKIDIEGNELNALKGMHTILAQNKPILFIEVIKEHLIKFGTGIDDVYAFLKSYGYTPYKIASANNLKLLDTAEEGELIIFICSISEKSEIKI